MPKLEIDGQEVEVANGTNLVQAAEQLGTEVPHYCYHPGLPVAGNCRMCLVEIEKMPKLQIACNTRANEGMVVHTKSDRVLRARESVLEFLLVNHPIDCPICDQAGECKLQDYYMDHDRQESRIPLESKVSKGKAIDIGPMIMLDQERCILCTRCTRFLDEVTGTSELGIFERGNHCQIDLFPGVMLDNPYSGNVADICPVGALTNKDFRFRTRVWYLESTPSVCPGCATGCNIDIHHRSGEVFRYRPRHNPDVNSYWMCDEGRLSYKRYQGEGRLLQPVQRAGEDWQPIAWDAAVGRFVDVLKGDKRIAGVISAQSSNEEIFLFDQLVREQLSGQVAGHSWSPEGASSDELLIDGDKNPNTAGLTELGLTLDARKIIDSALAGEIDTLVLYGTDLTQVCTVEEIAELGDKLDAAIVLDLRYGPSLEIADLVLPIASYAEIEGSFINRQRRCQVLGRSMEPTGHSWPGWQLLTKVAGSLGAPSHDSASAVFERIADKHAAFRGLTLAGLAGLGAPLGGATSGDG